MCNQDVVLSPHVKLLGVQLDEKLTWKPHVQSLVAELSKITYILNTLKRTVPTRILALIYFGLFHSKIQYGCILWGAASASVIDPLLKVQKKAVRHVFNAGYNFPTGTLFKKLNTLRVQDIYRLQCIKLTYRLFNGLLPQRLEAFFSLNANVHGHDTRQRGHIHAEACRLTIVQRSFLHQCRLLEPMDHHRLLGAYFPAIKANFVQSCHIDYNA